MCRLLLLLALGLLLATTPALAQAPEYVQRCLNPQTPDDAQFPCTMALTSGRLTSAQQIRAYLNRAWSYLDRHSFGLAEDDFRKALALNPGSQEARKGLTMALQGGAPPQSTPERGGRGADSPELQRARQALAQLDRLPPSPLAAARGGLICEIVANISVKHEPYCIGPVCRSVFWSLLFTARENGEPGGRDFARAEKVYVASDQDTARTPERSAAVEALAAELMRTGWEPFARGEHWYSYRFRRRG